MRRPRPHNVTWRGLLWSGIAAVLIAGGIAALAIAVSAQRHAPAPSRAAVGSLGPVHPTTTTATGGAALPATTTPVPTTTGPILPRSLPVSISIPVIHVRSPLQSLGLNPNGTLAVPPPGPTYNEAAWYDGSPTPGELGPSVIEGHVDSARDGPSVFFDLGALQPGDIVDVSRADGTVAVFVVSGVRRYPKNAFPTAAVYGNTTFAALRLITCGGDFDHATRHYLENTVVFASLVSSHAA